ncbi:MAG TPA: IS66 family transposase [Saprospiraceae bacterium]|nr:IS66 family transposase [Saprospiraceae bacterium]
MHEYFCAVKLDYDTCTREELIASHQEQAWKIEELTHKYKELERVIFGRKSERFVAEVPADQLRLIFAPGEDNPEPRAQEKQQVSYTRKKAENKQHPVRQQIPPHLPREVIDLHPEGCDDGMEIGKPEVTEVLEYKPGKLQVIQYRRHKYKIVDAAGKEKIVIPELPDRGIDKGMVGPGLLSHVITDKYLDHTPLYRQSQQFAREEVDLPRSTLSGWISQCYDLLLPLYNVLEKEVVRSSYLQVDESSIRVLTKTKEKKSFKGCMQVYHAVEEQLVWFRYTRTKEQANLIDILKEFRGNLQVDGNVSYDEFKKIENEKRVYPQITVSHCMAHARRKFEQALDNDNERASHVLTEIRKLYEIERLARDGLDKEAIELLRKEQSLPILKALKQWLDKEYERALPKSLIGKAIAYTLKRWIGLCEYLHNGNLLIDNNLVENTIRPLALGRKNYLFAGSHNGARWAAMFYSFSGTCKVNGIDMFSWLREVLIRIQNHPVNRIHELLPTKNYRFLHKENET